MWRKILGGILISMAMFSMPCFAASDHSNWTIDPATSIAYSEETIDMCTDVYAEMIDSNHFDFAVSFSNGTVYYFSAFVATKGGFIYEVYKGEEPPCFAKDHDNQNVKTWMIDASRKAGYRVPSVG